METQFIFYGIYYTAFALFKKKNLKNHTLMMTSLNYIYPSSHASFCCPLHNLH